MLLLDNSAWARLSNGAVDDARLETIAGWMAQGHLAICLPFLLEAGYSARSARDHRTIMADLQRLPRIELEPEIERSAVRAQEGLARAGHHRLPPTDIVIAACADHVGAGILHYDRDYDLLAEHTELAFTSEWLAPRGSL